MTEPLTHTYMHKFFSLALSEQRILVCVGMRFPAENWMCGQTQVGAPDTARPNKLKRDRVWSGDWFIATKMTFGKNWLFTFLVTLCIFMHIYRERDKEAWCVAVYGVATSWTQLSYWTEPNWNDVYLSMLFKFHIPQSFNKYHSISQIKQMNIWK